MALFQHVKQEERHSGGTGIGLLALAKRVESTGGCCGLRNRLDGAPGCLFWFCIPYQPDCIERTQRRNAAMQSTAVLTSAPASQSSMQQNMLSKSPISPQEQSTLSSIDNDRLPVEAPDKLKVPAMQALSLDESASQEELLILVVDDSILIQKTISRALTKEGYKVKAAANGVECLKALEKDEFSVILLDINMPVMDGIETIKNIREIERQDSNIKRRMVIGMSANSDHATKSESLDSG